MNYDTWLGATLSAPAAAFAVMALLASSWTFGEIALGLLKVRLRSPSIKPFCSVCAGLNLWSLLGLALGTAGGLGPLSAKTLLSLSIIPFACLALRRLRDWRGLPALCKRNAAIFIAAGLLFAFLLGNALCLPVGIGVDEQSYQLPVPARWMSDSFPHVYADLPYSGYPSLPSFLFWIVMSAGKTGAPRLLVLCLHMLNLAALYFLLRAFARPAVSLILSFIFFLACAHAVFLSEVFAEPFLLLDMLCGLMVIHELKGTKAEPSKSFLAGLMAGGAAAIKLTGLAPAAALGLGLVMKNGWRLKSIGPFVAGGLLCAPFYLRTLLETGNPFHPYYGWIFSSDPATVAMSRHYHLMGSQPVFGLEGFANALASPFRLCWDESSYDGQWGLQFMILLILCAAGFAIGMRRRPMDREAAYFGAGGAFLYAFWLSSAQQARFLEPAIVLLLLGAALFIRRLKPNLRIVILLALMACAAISAPWGWARHYFTCWRVVAEGVSPARFLDAAWEDNLCGAYAELDRVAPKDAKVMLVYEKRLLHCPRPYAVGTPLYQAEYFAPPPTGSPKEIERKVMDDVAKAGVSYIILKCGLDKVDSLPDVERRTAGFRAALASLVGSDRLKVIWGSPSHLLLKVER